MPGTKYIKDALGLVRERCQAIGLAEGVHALSPTRQNFMGVSLVPDIPDELVDRGVVRIVKCNRELNDAKACTKSPPENCLALGMMYGEGRGVDKSDEYSVALATKACQEGLRKACRHIKSLE